ncbi:MAG: hypothetical protein ACR2RL_02680, partial [Gammaproteobacteria bacterium]
MTKPEARDRVSNEASLLARLRAAARKMRWQRAIDGATRAVLLVHVVLIPLLVLKQLLVFGPEWYLAVVMAAALSGAVHAGIAALPLIDVARHLDARLGLQERLQTAWEFRGQEPSSMVQALIDNAAAACARASSSRLGSLVLPRNARYLPIVLAVAATLIWLPGVPMPYSTAPDVAGLPIDGVDSLEDPQPLDRLDDRDPEDPTKKTRLESTVKPNVQFKDSQFRDTPLDPKPPDFLGFIERGDARFSLLSAAPAMPTGDDVAPFQIELTQASHESSSLQTQQVQRQEVADRIEELEHLWGSGQSPGSGGERLAHESSAEPAGGSSGTQENANEHRAPAAPIGLPLTGADENSHARREEENEQRERFGGVQYAHDAPGTGLPPWLRGPRDPHFQDAGIGSAESTGKTSGQPGVGHSLRTHAPADPRIDAGGTENLRVRGRMRPGEQDAYDTDLPGLAADVPSRLEYRAQRAQYSRRAEE